MKSTYLLSLLLLLEVGCGQTKKEAILNEVVSDHLLLQSQEQIIEALGTPRKQQKRTGGFSAYYFEDSTGTHVVVTFNEAKEAVDLVICSNSNPEEVLTRILMKHEWEQVSDRKFGNPVYINKSNGYSIYTDKSCTYLTTNW